MHINSQEARRPRNWEEVMGLTHSSIGSVTDKELLKNLFTTGAVRYYIFVGPAGCGKTSVGRVGAATYLEEDYSEIEAAALNPDDGSPYYLEVNASGDRKLDDLSRINEEFVSKSTDNGKCRVVLFDEADGFPYTSQDYLRAMIESTLHKTIYIFCLNKVGRMHEALLSRGSIFYFDPIDPEQGIDWLMSNCIDFNINISREIATDVFNYFKGDLRSVTNKFLNVYQGLDIEKWEPRQTFAEEIYNAHDQYSKYLELASKHYIDTVALTGDLFRLCGRKNPIIFFKASEMLKGAFIDPEIGIFYLIKEGLSE